MNKKLYKRDGRKFVPVEDLTGEIKVVEGTEALCMLQTPTKRYWAAVDDSGITMTHYNAKRYASKSFNGKGMLPKIEHLLMLRRSFKNKVRTYGICYWTDEHDSYDAWVLRWTDGNMGATSRSTSFYVRAFYVEYLLLLMSMSKWIRIQNQQNPPGKKRVDSQGNIRKKFIVKREGATIIIAEGCTKENYLCAWTRFCNDIEAGGGKVLAEGKPIQLYESR